MSTINVGYIEGPSTASNKIYIKSGSVLDITNSPDGAASIDLAVDGSDITTGTVTAARLPVGTVINSEMFTYSTRTAFVAASTATYYWSVNYTKKLTDSILVVTCFVPTAGSSAGNCGTLIQIDGTNYYSCFYNYTGEAYAMYLDGIAQKQVSTSGTKTIKLGWSPADSTANKPFNYWCPNASDDSRNQQTVSVIQVLEVTV